MKKTFKIVIVSCFMLMNFVTFAQEASPSSEDSTGSGNLEGTDAPASPINGGLWILIFLGVVYSYSLIMRNRQIKKS